MNYREKYNQLVGQRDKILTLKEGASDKLKVCSQNYEDALIAQSIIHKSAKTTQEKLRFNIEKIVTAFVQALPFDEQYTFELEFVTKNNRTHCIPTFKDASGESFDAMADLGGSVVNPASFASRISLWTLMGKNKTAPIFILDEVFGNVREDFWDMLAGVVKTICDDFDLQIITTSVLPVFNEVADTVIEVKKEGGYSKAYVEE